MVNRFLILVFIFSTGCGTDTGNPGQDNNTTHAGTDGNITVIDHPGKDIIPQLTENICKKLSVCHSNEMSDCESSLYQSTNIDEEIGIGENDYGSLEDIDQAFSNDELIDDPNAFDSCLNDINSLSCESDAIENAYNNSISQPYTGVAKMLPLSCSEVNSAAD